MHTLVLGGIRSGKSGWAERLAATGSRPVRYLATAPDRPDDPDWAARVRTHRERRPGNWDTREVGSSPAALPAALRAAGPGSVVLVDDVGNWLVGAFDAVCTAGAMIFNSIGAWALAGPMTVTANRAADARICARRVSARI